MRTLITGIILCWLLTRPHALCIVTGPSQMILGSVTFTEIRRCLDGAVIPFGGKISKGLKASPAVVEIAPGWRALGFATTSVEWASGQHARHLLAVVEEAYGIAARTPGAEPGRAGRSHLANFCPGVYYVRLVEELRPLTYGLVGHKTKLMPKDEWSTILGDSPDIADALIQSMLLAS